MTENRSSKAKIKPPPNYLSRRFQLRLMTMVGSLLLILFLMSEARRPENWKWLFELDKTAQEPAANNEEPPADADTITTSDDDAQIALLNTKGLTDPLDMTLVDGWSRVLRQFAKEEQYALRGLIMSARRKSAATGDANQNATLLSRVDDAWNRFFLRAMVGISEPGSTLTDEEKAEWIQTLDQAKRTWQAELSSLSRYDGHLQLETSDFETLAALQRRLDYLDLNSIEDNTIHRSVEHPAWFRFLEILEHETPDQLATRSVGDISFLQLFNQPDLYRGKLVTVEGRVRLAYRVPARKNDIGVDGYYLFWIQTEDSSDAPIVAYCLDPPAGFPEVPLKTDKNRGLELNEDVQVTGYFFKRWVYPTDQGASVAPLVLAKAPDWQPRAPEPVSDSGVPVGILTLCIVAALAVGVALAWAAYRFSPAQAQPGFVLPSQDEGLPDELPEFEDSAGEAK